MFYTNFSITAPEFLTPSAILLSFCGALSYARIFSSEARNILVCCE